MAKILLVDDEDAFRRVARLSLQRAGYEVFEARNGSEAIRCYSKVQPDLVITDLIMPEKEGLETIQELRQLHSEARIIAISGGGRLDPMDYLPVAKKFGANYTLAKPFLHHELIKAIESVLALG